MSSARSSPGAGHRPPPDSHQSRRLRPPERYGRNAACSIMAPTLPSTDALGVIGSPSTRAPPAVGRTRPSNMRSAVVLPAPFGPSKPHTAPEPTENERSSTASTPLPKRFVSPATSITGAARISSHATRATCEALRVVADRMTAAVYVGDGAIEVQEVPVPELGARDALIEVSHCGICGTDLHLVLEKYARPGSVLGHEWSGTIAAVGSDVTDW